MNWSDTAIVASVLVVWISVSGKAERFGITQPMVFTLTGLILGGNHDFGVSLNSSTVRLVAEVTLTLVLFADASRIQLPVLRHDLGTPSRLLGVGLPLTIIAGAAVAYELFGFDSVWMAILFGATLAPTDASLGAAIVNDPRVPSRVRRALNIESGLNDGIVAPLIAMAVTVLAGASTTDVHHVIVALREIGGGVAIGVGVGLLAGWLLSHAVTHEWTTADAASIAVTAAALGSYAIATSLDANGFVAAFVGGLCFSRFVPRIDAQVVEGCERTGQLLGCFVWFLFGAGMLRPALESPLLARALVYALISLTVVRMVPVALSLIGTKLGRPTVAYVGWFGPRGMASVIFALLASDSLGSSAHLLLVVVSLTVGVSIVAHGFSANVLTGVYVRSVKALGPDHPVSQPLRVPRARRPLGTPTPE